MYKEFCENKTYGNSIQGTVRYEVEKEYSPGKMQHPQYAG
jgi:hypothetical protein